jgi:hypothetical protein
MPANVVLLSQAELAQRLQNGQVLNLWRYPLEVQVRAWAGGWDVLVRRELLATGNSWSRGNQRARVYRLLQTLLETLHPLLLSGPTRRPPPTVYHALREYEQCRVLYLNQALGLSEWQPVLSPTRTFPLNGGQWFQFDEE